MNERVKRLAVAETKDYFLSRIVKDGDCWLWCGSVLQSGYGQFDYKGKAGRAHRVAWELFKGKIPSDLHVLHKCDVPRCVNPDHLFLGTHLDNMRDAKAKGRMHGPASVNCHFTKLTESNVIEARRLHRSGTTIVALAKKFNVTMPAMHYAVKGKTWKYLNASEPPSFRHDLSKGNNHHSSKVSDNDIAEMKNIHSQGVLNTVQLGKMFGLSSQRVGRLIRYGRA